MRCWITPKVVEIVINKGKQKLIILPSWQHIHWFKYLEDFFSMSYFWQLKNPRLKKWSDCGHRKTRIAIAEWDDEATLLKWF